ncbi:hypothetical protein CLU79DRAFT_780275 [Phycomyces nitens]|nr:hypothetical protein CLU79DRAFT_780275 [Phycomyces nitens]
MLSKLPHEVLSIITASLVDKEIRACSEVSKEWSQIFEYFRWKNMLVSLHKLKNLQEIEKAYWADYGYHSSSLHLIYNRIATDNSKDSHTDNINNAQSYFPNIKGLQFDFDEKCIPTSILFEQVHGWSSLTRLNLCSFGESCTLSCKELDELFHCLPNLADLGLHSIDIDSDIPQGRETTVTPVNLKTLEIKNGFIPYKLSHYCAKKFPSLHSIIFDTIDVSSSPAPEPPSYYYSRNSFLKEYLNNVENANIHIRDTSGRHIYDAICSLQGLLSFPLRHLSLTVSVNFRQHDNMATTLLSLIPALQHTLETLHLDLNSPVGKRCFALDLDTAPYLKDLKIRYLNGGINFRPILSKCPRLKMASFEVKKFWFEDKICEPHGLESIELIGLSISSKSLHNLSSHCHQIRSIKMSSTVKIY